MAKKMGRKGRTKVIYKGTFISKQSLSVIHVIFACFEKSWLNQEIDKKCIPTPLHMHPADLEIA